MLDSGVQLLHRCMWYLLEVDAALQTSQYLDRRRHSTRHGRPTTKYIQFMLHLSKMCQRLSTTSCSRCVVRFYIYIYTGCVKIKVTKC